MNQELLNIIYELESHLLKTETRSSVNALNSLLADDFREFGKSGRVYDKKEILERLPKEPEISGMKYSISDFVIKELSDDVVLSTFKTSKITSDEDPETALRSSLWKKVGNNTWQIIFHQGTPVSSNI